MRLPHLATRVFNTPLAIHPGKLDTIAAFLSVRFGTEAPVSRGDFGEPEKREIYSVAPGGIAVIDICGTLVNRAGGMDAMSGMTSYEEIGNEITRALADEAVTGIMLRLGSPGGEALGLSAIAQQIADAGKQKPVWAAVDAYAFSAAYWIASAAEQIYIPQDGEAGSIGTIARHVDQSEWNKTEGIKVTAVHFGAKKNDFSPHEPLSNEAHERLQADVDTLGGMFVDAVAKNRKMAKKGVRDMEAGTFIGQQAIDAGLADHLGSFRDAMAAMTESLATGKRSAPIVIVRRSISEVAQRNTPRGSERRDFAVKTIRSAGTEAEPQITGHMAVFGEWSSDLGGFTERIMPGAFAKTLREADIHDYFNHDANFVLGRVRSGTLELSEDETGLHSVNHPPDTQLVRDLVLAPIARGDIDQGSIAFRHVRQEWSRIDGEITRTLHEVRLYHVSPVAQGAYSATSLALASQGIDFHAVACAMAKQEHGCPLSEDERVLLQQSIEALTRCLSVAPGLAAHPTVLRNEPPPVDLTALQTRVRRVKAAMLATA
jgi:HK97 family phage prohead protease